MSTTDFIKKAVEYILRGVVYMSRTYAYLGQTRVDSALNSYRTRENSTLGVPRRDTTPPSNNTNKIKIRIELPITPRHPQPRKFVVTMPKGTSVGRLRIKLANEFKVQNKDWRIVAIDDKNKQRILEDKEMLDEIEPEKRKRIYFYPNIF